VDHTYVFNDLYLGKKSAAHYWGSLKEGDAPVFPVAGDPLSSAINPE